jgi:hypothetical protein
LPSDPSAIDVGKPGAPKSASVIAPAADRQPMLGAPPDALCVHATNPDAGSNAIEGKELLSRAPSKSAVVETVPSAAISPRNAPPCGTGSGPAPSWAPMIQASPSAPAAIASAIGSVPNSGPSGKALGVPPAKSISNTVARASSPVVPVPQIVVPAAAMLFDTCQSDGTGTGVKSPTREAAPSGRRKRRVAARAADEAIRRITRWILREHRESCRHKLRSGRRYAGA